MNKERSAALPAPLPPESTAVAAPPLVRPAGGRARRPPPRPQGGASTAAPASSRRRIDLRIGLLCLALTLGLGAALIPALRVAYGRAEGVLTPEELGQSVGQGLLQGGLPPTNDTPLVGGTCPVETTGDEACTDVPEETDGKDSGHESLPPEPADTTAPDAETDTYREPMPTLTEPSDTYAEPATTPAELETGEEVFETNASTDMPTETETEPPETEAPVPEGCYPIVSADMSEPHKGSGYVTGSVGSLPPFLPGGELWSTAAAPTVLIVNTHPYEGYGDGGDYYDPSAGGLALTDSPSAADGTVALAAALTRELRGRGVTVIHLRIAVAAGDTAADTYERTATTVRAYCRMYPEIGLVLDLRRSAELTAAGGILRTEGRLDGETCAQLRLSVSGGRPTSALQGDLLVALALREALWTTEPTLSRPVHVKTGGGLLPETADVRCLTLEMGAAGNTYAEAERLTSPVAEALAALVLNEK